MSILIEEMVSYRIRSLLSQNSESAERTFGDALHMGYLGYSVGRREYLFACRTESWMQNPNGVVHGGICATIADQAMGIVAYCVKEQNIIAPTVQLQINYHRPLLIDKEVTVGVQVVSVSAQLIHVQAQAVCADRPESVCFSAAATFFCKV